jgi:hypothetical protein
LTLVQERTLTNKLRRVFPVLLFLLLAIPGSVFSADFGLLLNQVPALESAAGETAPSYTGTLVPWFSMPLGGRSSLYLSGGVSIRYTETEEWKFIPELYRFEAVFRSASRAELKFGRVEFHDPSGYTASGLFDGLIASFNAGLGRIRAGAFYTGLLHKRTAHIAMTEAERADYDAPVDWAEGESYFAPSRALVFFEWEQAGLITERDKLSLGLLGQWDVSDLFGFSAVPPSPYYHSQYLTARYIFPVHTSIDLNAGGAAELIEEEGGAPGFALSTFLGAGWLLPTALSDRLSLELRWASGNAGLFKAFNPVSTRLQGRVLQARFSGLAVIEGRYNVRLASTVSTEIAALCFFRTDENTIADAVGSSYFLGTEVYGRCMWVPVPDLSLILGGGVFLPQGAYKGQELRWKGSLGLMVSLY